MLLSRRGLAVEHVDRAHQERHAAAPRTARRASASRPGRGAGQWATRSRATRSRRAVRRRPAASAPRRSSRVSRRDAGPELERLLDGRLHDRHAHLDRGRSLRRSRQVAEAAGRGHQPRPTIATPPTACRQPSTNTPASAAFTATSTQRDGVHAAELGDLDHRQPQVLRVPERAPREAAHEVAAQPLARRPTETGAAASAPGRSSGAARARPRSRRSAPT